MHSPTNFMFMFNLSLVYMYLHIHVEGRRYSNMYIICCNCIQISLQSLPLHGESYISETQCHQTRSATITYTLSFTCGLQYYKEVKHKTAGTDMEKKEIKVVGIFFTSRTVQTTGQTIKILCYKLNSKQHRKGSGQAIAPETLNNLAGKAMQCLKGEWEIYYIKGLALEQAEYACVQATT